MGAEGGGGRAVNEGPLANELRGRDAEAWDEATKSLKANESFAGLNEEFWNPFLDEGIAESKRLLMLLLLSISEFIGLFLSDGRGD